ncbi:dihydrofolate reductase family protein [Metabacillus sp. FJAT-52054]|uniref:Dihydrofolate reductase family protein n=2 Tax=Bacillaceae TaxID=186817 RepID=A0ABZ2NG49_9BACI
MKGSPSSLISKLKEQPGKDIWLIGGGDLIREFLKEKLVDQFMIAVIPVLLGKGIPLFKQDFPVHNLKLSNTQIYNEIVMLSYDKKQ